MDIKIDQHKYENAILYFVKYCNNSYLGATKLNKLMYYLDFLSFRDTKKSVTGDLYVHKQFGPVPSKMDDILTELQSKNILEIKKVQYKDGETFKYETKQDPDLSIFNTYEKKLLENICEEFCLWKTDKIVNQTHLEAPWFYSKPYEIVDYKYSKDLEFFA
ncbi:MAG: Panacea domain-containing protein [Candidatus Taylorbacteria bacterium]